MIAIERVSWDGRGDPGALAARIRGLVPELGEVRDDVTAILERVRAGGDAALFDLARELDRFAPEELRIDPARISAAPQALDPEVRDALEVAARNIEAGARAELEAASASSARELPEGQRVEVVRAPVESAAIYAPGGRAAYPSSVLMGAIPARVAGVGRLVVATPAGKGGVPADAVLAACAIARVEEVLAIGGAQAIAALAFGTESIDAVEVIAGPGNRYVAEAKRQVADRVGIDGLAGPSELVVIADGEAPERWLALDLLAQAEHGADSPLVVLSPDRGVLDGLAAAVEELAGSRPSVAAAPAALVEVPDLEAAFALADAIAPEHLELAYRSADERTARERVAGCVFVGPASATAFGDYAAGSNHILPTGGAARFGGPLGPGSFIRRTSVVSMSRVAVEALAPHVAALARVEGLPVHGESAIARAEEMSG